MRTFALANQKGGCGKTTVSINLAAALAQEGRRVLLVDMDPQGHCALGLAVPEEQIQYSIADILLQDGSTGPVELEQAAWRISNNFDLIPSTIGLVRFENIASTAEHRDLFLRLALSGAEPKYDYCIVDCPPHIGLLTYNALRACSDVIVPVDTGYFSMHGLDKALDTIEDLNARTKEEVRVHVLPNCYDVRTRLAREILNELRRRHGDRLLKSYINFNSKLKEGASFGQAISEYDPTSTGCRDFTRLARELIESEVKTAAQEELISHADALSARAEALLATDATLMQRRKVIAELPAVHAEAPQSSESAAVATLVEPASTVAPMEPVAAPMPTSHVAQAASPQPTDHARIEARIDDIYGVRRTPDGVEFSTSLPGAREVLLAGDFNNWSPRNCPMVEQGAAGHFKTTLKLGAGRYRYRLVVDGRWQKDPCNELTEVNEFGELNSVAEIA
jgi:chromosome partitioning protein